jgi:hypothetical protein
MPRNGFLSLLAVSAGLFAASDHPWKDKQATDWTDEDAKLVLTDSPWAKTVYPTMDKSSNSQQPRRGMGHGGGGGIGIGGIGLGLPGGMGRRGGMGGPGGGYPGGGGGQGGGSTQETPPTLKLRWESAEPIREAELKARETNAPTIDEAYYGIAVYGVPGRMLTGDTKALAGQLKKQAVIKREGKKDWKPASVEVLEREDGPVVL